MDPLDPMLQYGPKNGAYVGVLQIVLVAIGILASSWLFGAAYALIVNYNKGKNNIDETKE